jgi:general secretion pathway protein E
MPKSTSRKSAPAAAATAAPDLLAILLRQGVMNEEQVERVRRAQKVNQFSAEQALVQLSVVNEVQIAQAVANEAGLPYVKINPLDLDLDVVTKAVAGPFARRHGMVAIGKTGDRLTVAVHNPFAPFPYEDIKRVTGLDVDRVVATRSDVESINKGFYDLKSSLKHAEKQLAESRIATVDIANQEFLSKADADLDPAAAPVVKALDQILANAFEQRASDIHFEPKRELTLVRLRIDGVLHDVHVIPRIVYDAVVSRIKLLSGANLAEKRRPQDGRIKRDQGGREVELRVSTMPTSFGEKAVLRIFDPEVLLKGIDQLGFSPHDLPKFYDFIGRSTGIILVTGPTGSGKTTTLYSVLKHLSRPEINIVTIEDPVEMVFEDFNQVQVRPQIDVTFPKALRTVLRQDPDIIMVGEIRDAETAPSRAFSTSGSPTSSSPPRSSGSSPSGWCARSAPTAARSTHPPTRKRWR